MVRNIFVILAQAMEVWGGILPKSGQREDMMSGSQDQPVDPHFVRAVRNALHHLYDPTALRTNPLLAFFDQEQPTHSPAALRTRLFEAMQRLKPAVQTPIHTKSWRFYHILQMRFQEQYSQQEVATDLGLSIRHLRREEALAIGLLAGELWMSHRVADHWPQLLATSHPPSSPEPTITESMPWQEEMARLQDEQTREPVAVAAVLHDVVELIRPLAQIADVTIEDTLHLPHLLVDTQRTALRQLLLHIFGAAIQLAAAGQIALTTRVQQQHVEIKLWIMPAKPLAAQLSEEVAEALTIAQQLCEYCLGTLAIIHPTAYDRSVRIQLALPLFQRIPVLTIDDNRDTLQLLQRYLMQSRYHFIGVTDPQQAFPVAEKYHPPIILLDVMLPEVDGWELLGRLRQHPVTESASIIICTILPQQQLALALGAAAFLRKPFTQQSLLATLDRQVDHRAPEFP